ncbi:unnamed protein product, partial [Didymodactylos carnosus]
FAVVKWENTSNDEAQAAIVALCNSIPPPSAQKWMKQVEAFGVVLKGPSAITIDIPLTSEGIYKCLNGSNGSHKWTVAARNLVVCYFKDINYQHHDTSYTTIKKADSDAMEKIFQKLNLVAKYQFSSTISNYCRKQRAAGEKTTTNNRPAEDHEKETILTDEQNVTV